MLDINHIAKTFNPGMITEKRALADVDLHLAPGDFVTVIGGNGAGKSTVLNAVAGAFPVDRGSILIDGVDVTRLPEFRRVLEEIDPQGRFQSDMARRLRIREGAP